MAAPECHAVSEPRALFDSSLGSMKLALRGEVAVCERAALGWVCGNSCGCMNGNRAGVGPHPGSRTASSRVQDNSHQGTVGPALVPLSRGLV